MNWFLASQLSILFFTISSAQAFSTPWTKQSQPTAPWASQERREGRESFFKELSKEKEDESSALEEEASDPQAEEVDQDEVEARETIRKMREELAQSQVEKRNQIKAENVVASNKRFGGEGSELGLSELPWSKYKSQFPQEKFARKLLWPVEGGRLSSGYGVRGGRFHEGLDLTAPQGTAIRAASGGRVVFSGKLRGYGNTIVIYHGNGITSAYAHNFKNLKNAGETIRQGEIIAEVGRSGEARGTHCHFEIRQDGKPVNPLVYSYLKSPLVASSNSNPFKGF